jgi:spore coat protein U-like protein
MCVLTGAPAGAATSASFQATATIVSGCEINGDIPASGQAVGQFGTLSFGSHSGVATGTINSSMVSNASVVLSCTPGVTLTMTTDSGQHAGTTRNMQAGTVTQRVSYRLYRDAAFAQELIANQAVAVSFSDTTNIKLPIYGRATLPGNGAPGTYTDTVVVTLNW